VPCDRRLIVVTAHRRESFGRDLEQQTTAIRTIAERYADDVQVVWPVHPNPNVAGRVAAAFADVSNVALLEPLDYVSLVQLMRRAAVILTDSGGIQEEAPTFGVPVLVMRDTTERPEGIDAGVARLVGSDVERIVSEASRLLDDPAARARMSSGANPYGDGHAGERIAAALLEA
jgi:UDP-N-acetylglucosamine 2-epimerase